MHELGNPPQEVVGEGNMMMPNFAEMGQVRKLSVLMRDNKFFYFV